MPNSSSSKDKALVVRDSSFYSEQGTANIYELARFHLENGNSKGAEPILRGLTTVVPEYGPAWLALSYIYLLDNNAEQALFCADQSLKCNPELKQALLFQVTCHLHLRDLSSAGTILGEFGELIESGQVSNPQMNRFFRIQLARFQSLR